MASALEHLGTLLASPDQVLAKRMAHRDEALQHFGAMFSPAHLPTLTPEEFAEFLTASHATRYRAQLTADMDRLRAGLARLLDERTGIEQRLEWLWPTGSKPVPGMGKSIATPVLFVTAPDSYGIWNATSEAAMQRLGLWPTFPRGWSTARQYLFINRVMVTAAEQLGTDLWTLDALWAVVERKPAPAARTTTPPRTRTAPAPRPRQAAELATFTCRSCFLAKPLAQLSDTDGVCRDCADA